VGWNNETGAPQSVALDTLITAYAPALTDLSNNSQHGGEPPRASYTPEAAPDVIDISVDLDSTGKKRQTSKPLPDAVSTGPSSNTIVNFEVVTYHSDEGGTFADRQEEFTTVDCKCRLSASTSPSYPPGHIIWDGVDRYDNVGRPIDKATATQEGNANAAEALCTTCCRDHHDSNLSPIKYVLGSTGDHAHYTADGNPAGDGEVYIESCRFKRIDGILRVFQDWSLKDITVMNRNDLTTNSTLLNAYVDYQKDFILHSVAATAINTLKPTARTPINMTLNAQQQLEARGVYIDNVYDLSGTPNPTTYLNYLQESDNTDRLELIPFAEINLSLLADWSSSEPTNVSVTSEPIASIPDPDNNYYGAYSRGWLDALVQATPGATITATIRDDNNGLTQIDSVPSPTNISDSVDVNVGASIGAKTISGTYEISFPIGSTKFSAPVFNVDGIACTASDGDPLAVPPTPPAYSCSVNIPWTGTITAYVEVNGNASQRCTGTAFYTPDSGVSVNTIHDFTIACQLNSP